MRYSLVFCIVGMLTHAACADVPVAIQELVFGEELPAGPDGPVDFVYCLGVDGEDVSQEMISQLRRPNLTIVGESQCTQNRDPRTGGSFHTSSGQKAIFYRLSAFSMDGESAATVVFEAYHHGLYASGSTLRLELRNGEWHIAGSLHSWVASIIQLRSSRAV